MAKTLSEVIYEFENYEYSQEHYMNMKEAYELELMGIYAESQMFIAENTEEIRERFSNLNESYFFEADAAIAPAGPSALVPMGDDSNKSGFWKKLGTGIKDGAKKFWQGIVKVWNAIVAWFKKYILRCKDTAELADGNVKALSADPDVVKTVAEEIRSEGWENLSRSAFVPKEDAAQSTSAASKTAASQKALPAAKSEPKAPAKPNLSEDAVGGKIGAIIRKYWSGDFTTAGFTIDVKRQSTSHVNAQLFAGKKDKRKMEFRAKLAAALSTTVVNIATVNNESGSYLMSIDSLADVFGYVSDEKKETRDYVPDEYVNEVKSIFKSEQNKARKDGIAIDVRFENMNKTMKRLDEITAKLKEYQGIKESAEYDEFDLFEEAKRYKDMTRIDKNKLYEKLKKKVEHGADPKTFEGINHLVWYELQSVQKQNSEKAVREENKIAAAKGTPKVYEVYKDLMKSSAVIMKSYTGIETFRRGVNKELHAYLQSIGYKGGRQAAKASA